MNALKSLYYGHHIKHVKDTFEAMKEAHSLGGNAFQFFLTSPRRKLTDVSQGKIKEMNNMRKYVEKNDIKLFIHSPYTLNFAQNYKESSWWIKSMVKELEYADKLGAIGCVIHFGKALDLPINKAYDNMKGSIMEVIDKTPHVSSKIILETSAGQGTELGYRLEDFSKFYHSFPEKYMRRLGICIDTCHVFVSGYDLTTKEKVKYFFETFDKLFGIKNITVFHLNDSDKPLGSRVDRHARIGKGKIGKEGIKAVIRYAYKHGIPMILETPSLEYKQDYQKIIKWYKH